ncbi:hypothetical protein K7X08_011301 [Anisodus acutangulus]|uniref:Molybdenum cofactor sulfurase n=1 Tax=Anisodus acutangulus TaxID=402998 RepID=A0A9Q1RBQ9_9SOLA|nr:hypothetical protein K7X08_011301 [Anisodus acutangulus]
MGKDGKEQLNPNKDSKVLTADRTAWWLRCGWNDLFYVKHFLDKSLLVFCWRRIWWQKPSTLHGLDLRWSGSITPSEMQYVQQYVLAKYPEYCNGLVEGDKIDLYALCMNDESSESSANEKGKSLSRESLSPSFGTKIQVRNRALQQCGLSEEEYLVVFTLTLKEAMMMIGECYPFFRGNYYMTILGEEYDCIREFVTFKDSKVIAAPKTWLDLRIKGSQLSQYFWRKSKHSPKGLFAYPAYVEEMCYSMHWISEAHRNSWHVLLDASGLDAGKERLALALHRPDFVLCTVDNTHAQPSRITCLLVRKQSFETAASSAN